MPDMCSHACNAYRQVFVNMLGCCDCCTWCCTNECVSPNNITNGCCSVVVKNTSMNDSTCSVTVTTATTTNNNCNSCKILCNVSQYIQQVVVNYTRYLLVAIMVITVHYYLHH